MVNVCRPSKHNKKTEKMLEIRKAAVMADIAVSL